MLLAIDAGNTNTVVGLFSGSALRASWRLATRVDATRDEYGLNLRALLSLEGVSPGEATGAILASVVPPLTRVLTEAVTTYLGVEPLIVGPGVRTGMPILTDNPHEVGADRIVNAVAAFERYGGPVVVIDFGTSTNFDVVSAEGGYLGGIIAPGLTVSAQGLFERAARLSRVDIQPPPRVIGRNTVHCIQAGLFHGHAAMVEGLVRRIREETGLTVSTLVTPTVFDRAALEAVREAGAENMTIAVDCSTPELFERMRGRGARGPHRWERYLEGIREAVDVMGDGPNPVGVHLIIGLGETEEEAIRFIQQCYDMGARVHLFSFYPETGSPLEGRDQPPMDNYRRVQLARHVIDTGLGRADGMTFREGRLVDAGIPRDEWERLMSEGLAFMTTGCPGCNRPYANETPAQAAAGLLRNFPFVPTEEDTALIRQQM